MTNINRAPHEERHTALSLLLVTMLGACGGAIETDVANPEDEWVRLASAPGGMSANVDTDGRAIVTTRDGTGVIWATLETEEKLIFAWNNERYIYNHTGEQQQLSADGPAGDLVVGGLIGRGGRVGIPRYKKASGKSGPHLLTIHEINAADNKGTFSVTSCGNSVLCDGVNGSDEFNANFGEAVVVSEHYRLRLHEDPTNPDGRVIFSLIERSGDEPDPAAVVVAPEPAAASEPDASEEPIVPPTTVVEEKDDDFWVIPAIAFAFIGGAALASAISGPKDEDKTGSKSGTGAGGANDDKWEGLPPCDAFSTEEPDCY